MDFGLSAGGISQLDHVLEAESLGYDFCWVGDSPMLFSNPWPTLAMLAQKTHRIRIGTGVAVAGGPVHVGSVLYIGSDSQVLTCGLSPTTL